MVPATGSTVGKNSVLKTSAAAVPYRKKSYHSMAVPTKLAATTRTTDAAGGGAVLIGSPPAGRGKVSVVASTYGGPPHVADPLARPHLHSRPSTADERDRRRHCFPGVVRGS